MSVERGQLLALMNLSKGALFPSKGRERAKLVRQICDANGWDEDEFLPSYVVKRKADWGLTPGPRRSKVGT